MGRLTVPYKNRRQAGTPENIGRPAVPFDAQIASLVLEEMAKGQRSLRAICEDNQFPDRSIIFGWVLDHPEFAHQYVRARDIQQHGMVDDMDYIARTETDAAKAKLLVDVRKWSSSRLLPKVYGDKLNIDQTVTNNEAPMAELLRKMTPQEREAVRTILMAAQARGKPVDDDGVVPGTSRRIGK